MGRTVPKMNHPRAADTTDQPQRKSFRYGTPPIYEPSFLPRAHRLSGSLCRERGLLCLRLLYRPLSYLVLIECVIIVLLAQAGRRSSGPNPHRRPVVVVVVFIVRLS